MKPTQKNSKKKAPVKQVSKQQQLKNEINEKMKQLQQFCHTDKCKRINQCPRECGCKKELNLATSIAWTMMDAMYPLADILEGSVNDIDEYFMEEYMQQYNYFKNSVDYAEGIISNHYENNKELGNLLSMNKIINGLDEVIRKVNVKKIDSLDEKISKISDIFDKAMNEISDIKDTLEDDLY